MLTINKNVLKNQYQKDRTLVIELCEQELNITTPFSNKSNFHPNNDFIDTCYELYNVPNDCLDLSPVIDILKSRLQEIGDVISAGYSEEYTGDGVIGIKTTKLAKYLNDLSDELATLNHKV